MFVTIHACASPCERFEFRHLIMTELGRIVETENANRLRDLQQAVVVREIIRAGLCAKKRGGRFSGAARASENGRAVFTANRAAMNKDTISPFGPPVENCAEGRRVFVRRQLFGVARPEQSNAPFVV